MQERPVTKLEDVPTRGMLDSSAPRWCASFAWVGSLLTACSGAPHAPPIAIVEPAASSSSPEAEVALTHDDAVVARVPDRSNLGESDGPLVATVLPGMERLERMSFLDGGIVCGTRAGKSPVCVGDDRSLTASIEGLAPAKRLESAHGTRCTLLASGKLACSLLSPNERVASLTSTSVDDFAIGLTGEVYALGSSGNVIAHVAREDGTFRTKIVLRGVDAIAGVVPGVCARTLKGDVECTDSVSPLERATHSINLLHDVTALQSGGAEPGGVVRRKDGSLWAFGSTEDPLGATRLLKPDGGTVTVLDVGWEPDRCIVTKESGVACLDKTRSKSFADFISRRVSLPRAAVKFRPLGAPCVELDNGTVACWGARVEALSRLGLRTLTLSPGSVELHP